MPDLPAVSGKYDVDQRIGYFAVIIRYSVGSFLIKITSETAEFSV